MIVVLCFIADFKGQFHTLVPNTLLKYLHEVAVETRYKEGSVCEELRVIVLFKF